MKLLVDMNLSPDWVAVLEQAAVGKRSIGQTLGILAPPIQKS
jgi:predicted nuclease of predicted toxin-antitoxin system